MAFVSEDRKGVGLLLDESIAMNMVYTDMKVNRNFLKKFGFFSQFDEKTSDEKAEEMIKELYIRCTGPDQIVGRLSGGNQQKVCMARALLSKPKLLFVIGANTRNRYRSKAGTFKLSRKDQQRTGNYDRNDIQ